MTLPFVVEIPPPDLESALNRFATLPGCLLLESSANEPAILGRYSFLMADPFEAIVVATDQPHPFAQLRRILSQFQTTTAPGLPPMQGGIAGVFAYDLNRSIEKIPANSFDDLKTPAIAVGAYDVVLAWDHLKNKAWVISQGFPELEKSARLKRARQRAEFFLNLMQPTSETTAESPSLRGDAEGLQTPLYPTGTHDDNFLKSNFQAGTYPETVQQCIDYIYAGDVFQINLSQQLMCQATSDSLSLYQRLRKCNPSTFGGYFDLTGISDTDLQVISASPERFFSVRDSQVETRPIKGTRPRTGNPMVDLYEKDQLVASEKDRAENTMIVDLMRNDLSKVCTDDSIRVTQLCSMEEYRSVLHLVSAVEGRLRDECDLVDLLQNVFPGGSITGAPKVRAMEIIAELEPTSRGFYCGSMGYLGFDGNADLNILIRTITASKGWWQIPVGGGVVSQSDPVMEHQETWTKAQGMLNALRP